MNIIKLKHFGFLKKVTEQNKIKTFWLPEKSDRVEGP